MHIYPQKCNLCQLINELEVCSSHLERTINRFLLQLQTSIDQPLEACGIVTLDTLSLGGVSRQLTLLLPQLMYSLCPLTVYRGSDGHCHIPHTNRPGQ